MGNGRQQRMPTAEEIAEFQRMDREMRMEWMPPQVDVNGVERQCILCHSILHPIHNRGYDGSVGGFCSKLCRKDYERKLSLEGMSMSDVEMEVEKYEDWKPKKHSPVI
jgi:hypothetical protein